ncbi:transcriptional repressor [Siphonobacter sp.]|uniref:transcriptional repressor n=1 Tax=Siphonobacter sp. TaxID=1869184 RepID=UPI003B3BB967
MMHSINNRIDTYCIERGIRKSIKRNQVATVLERIHESMDAEQVWLLLKKNHFQISIGAVYQALNWLVEHGFVEKHIQADRKFIYYLTTKESELS